MNGLLRLRNSIFSGGGLSARQSFNAPLTTTIVPSRGVGSPTFTRATAATVQDWEGRVYPVLSGEVRFQGARRVRNLSAASSKPATLVNITLDSVIDDPNGGTLAGRYTIANGANFQAYTASTTASGSTLVGSLYLRGVGASVGKTVRLWIYDNGTNVDVNVTLTSSWVRFSNTRVSATGGVDTRLGIANNGTVATNDKVDVAFLQLEDVTGQSNQNPSEYVSVGVLAAPYHGANVDGVKYFSTQNGNTVV